MGALHFHEKTFFIIATCCMALSSHAQVQPKGYIQNDHGGKCWYTQTTEEKISYFHNIPGKLSTLTFDDPSCMRDSGLGLDINKMLINNIISRSYSHADAAFKTRAGELYPSSALQVRGQCIQSGKYPSIGVVVEYKSNGNGISQVRHSHSVGACRL